MGNSNIGTMVWKVVLQQFYLEQANEAMQCKWTTFHSSFKECYLKVRAINNLIDNRSNKSNASNKN